MVFICRFSSFRRYGNTNNGHEFSITDLIHALSLPFSVDALLGSFLVLLS